mmetsp:Transcript_14567/g.38489  ORF Transcript_14567/g.38489 Transcript_14567/m.38489 type:complete len:411 (-) Transcript_14567:1118-2350(-)
MELLRRLRARPLLVGQVLVDLAVLQVASLLLPRDQLGAGGPRLRLPLQPLRQRPVARLALAGLLLQALLIRGSESFARLLLAPQDLLQELAVGLSGRLLMGDVLLDPLLEGLPHLLLHQQPALQPALQVVARLPLAIDALAQRGEALLPGAPLDVHLAAEAGQALRQPVVCLGSQVAQLVLALQHHPLHALQPLHDRDLVLRELLIAHDAVSQLLELLELGVRPRDRPHLGLQGVVDEALQPVEALLERSQRARRHGGLHALQRLLQPGDRLALRLALPPLLGQRVLQPLYLVAELLDRLGMLLGVVLQRLLGELGELLYQSMVRVARVPHLLREPPVAAVGLLEPPLELGEPLRVQPAARGGLLDLQARIPQGLQVLRVLVAHAGQRELELPQLRLEVFHGRLGARGRL